MLFWSSGVNFHMTYIDYKMHCLVDFGYLAGINSKYVLITVVIAGVSVRQPVGYFSCFLNQLNNSSSYWFSWFKKKRKKSQIQWWLTLAWTPVSVQEIFKFFSFYPNFSWLHSKPRVQKILAFIQDHLIHSWKSWFCSSGTNNPDGYHLTSVQSES